jgi:hypothetical protein
MNSNAAVTVLRSPEEARELWERSPSAAALRDAEATVSFSPAPGDRGTEIRAELDQSRLQRVTGGAALAKVKDQLRHFKQRVETGEIPRSDGSPEGERAERKVKQRPAQPLPASERDTAGAR